jgi:hypothetical protein
MRRRVIRTSSENFITDQETSSIVKLLEFIDHLFKGLKLCRVPRWIILSTTSIHIHLPPIELTYLVDLRGESVQIHKQIYPCV